VSGSRRGPGHGLVRSRWARRNDSARSATGGSCRITVAGSGGRVSPDSFVSHRSAVDSPRSGHRTGGNEETTAPVVPPVACRVGSLGQPPAAVHEPDNRVTRSADPVSITDQAGSPGAVRLVELIRPASVARHGRGAFTTDLRGGLSQWFGGRLGSFDSWHGPRTASAVVRLFVDIAPGLNILMSVVCSRPALASARLIKRSLILTRPLFKRASSPALRFMITESPGHLRTRSSPCKQPRPRHRSSVRLARS